MHNDFTVLIPEYTKEQIRIPILRDDKENCSNTIIQPEHNPHTPEI